jgi:ubiquinone/menaquinone biosynthesis C-methylase UbiE
LDIDPQKLDGLRNSGQQAVIRAVLGSATDIPLRSRSVDTALCIAMSHHLDDREVEKLFAEISRVCRGRMIFVDPVERSSSLASRILWKYDRGSHPRSVDVLRRLVQDKFDILHEERYAIFHEYWLCAARPR